MAWVLPKPLDINLLLNCVLVHAAGGRAAAHAPHRKQAIAATAIAVCQGAGVNLALTPGHAGVRRGPPAGQGRRRLVPPGEARAGRRRSLTPTWPSFWGRLRRRTGAAQCGTFLEALPRQPGRRLATGSRREPRLACRGVFSRLLYLSAQGGYWPESLKQFRAVLVPELALLDQAHLEQLRRYVRQGGRLIAFGHASILDEKGGAARITA